jgi:hypothetical protein
MYSSTSRVLCSVRFDFDSLATVMQKSLAYKLFFSTCCAHEALAHYLQSFEEQRDQDQRRYEQKSAVTNRITPDKTGKLL